MLRLACLIAILVAIGAQEVTDATVQDAAAAPEVNVKLRDGEVVGFADKFEDKELDVFLGVPYAQPPVDQLRFKKPLPLLPWTTPIQAKKLAPSCHQNVNLFPEESIPESEDCLYLNIWAPKTADTSPKAVLVWIHGGGLVFGSASSDQYNGKVLAARGDVVVVTINYRLNALGFMHLGGEEAPGNAGLYDQTLAIEWISDNIAQFGGDPDRVTIFGESAGSWSVGFHLLSPYTRNLFQNAIMLSGAPLSHTITNKQNVLQSSLTIAKLVNCGDGLQVTPDLVDCLRKVPADQLAKIVNRPEVSDEPVAIGVYPLVLYGDAFLPIRPVDMLKNGDFKRDGSLLFGTTEDEGGMFLVTGQKQAWLGPAPAVTKQQTMEEAKRMWSKVPFNPKLNIKDAVKFYFIDKAENDGPALSRALGDMMGDYFLKCPALRFGREVFEYSQGKKKPVYQYLWSYKAQSEGFKNGLGQFCTPQMGACHASELFALFGSPFSHPGFDEDDKRISEQLMDTVVTFAKTGKPPKQNNVEWPKYKSIQSKTLRVYYNFDRAPKAGFKKSMDESACEVIWNRFLNN